MEKPEIIEKLSGFLKRALADKDVVITPSADFVSDLGLDSAGHLEFFLMMEEEFDIEYEDEDEEEDERGAIKCVNDAVELVLKKAA